MKRILPVLGILSLIGAGCVSQTSNTAQPDTDTNSDSPNTSDVVTYADKVYGWSFAYSPKDWQVNESDDGITLSSVSTTIAGSKRAPVSTATISFSTVKKADFKPAGSKVGNISYDLDQDALVDTSGDTVRCLPPLPNNASNPNPQLAIFEYGGSLMSTPAYFWDAVMTDKDYLVLVKTTSDMYTDKENTDNVFSTLTLPDGVRSPVPACAENE